MEIRICLHLFENLMISFYIAFSFFVAGGPVKPLKDIWLVGDQFLEEIFYILHDLKMNSKSTSHSDMPYLYDYYNVKNYYSNPLCLTSDMPGRLVNKFVSAMMENTYLPCIILSY